MHLVRLTPRDAVWRLKGYAGKLSRDSAVPKGVE